MSERTLRVLVADDEAMARKRLLRLLDAIPNVAVIGECKSGREVLHYVASCKVSPDVLLLDIRMPELSGLEARARLPEDGPYVIFTTAHPEHALEAFEVGADDYVLKPIEAANLQRALQRAAVRLGRPPKPIEVRALQRIPVQTSKGLVMLDPAQLSHAQLDGELTAIHSSKGVILSDLSLRQLHDLLPDSRFWRVHRKALLNLESMERLENLETGGCIAHMTDGSSVPVSRQAGRRLRRLLGVSG